MCVCVCARARACFLELYVEFLRLGAELELQLLAYATAPATSNLSRICDLSHSSQQRRIINPLTEARDQTHNLTVTSRIHFHCATTGTPTIAFNVFLFSPIKVCVCVYMNTRVCPHAGMYVYVLRRIPRVSRSLFILVGSEFHPLPALLNFQYRCAQPMSAALWKAVANLILCVHIPARSQGGVGFPVWVFRVPSGHSSSSSPLPCPPESGCFRCPDSGAQQLSFSGVALLCCLLQPEHGCLVHFVSFVAAYNGWRASWASGTTLRLQVGRVLVQEWKGCLEKHCFLALGSVQDRSGDSDGCAGIRRGKKRELLQRWQKIEGESESGRGLAPSPCGLVVWLRGISAGNSDTCFQQIRRVGTVSVRGKQKWTED